ncbi:PDZ domain-containing protein [Liquorilactobacillus sicerae]|uniref:PDZ domain-containing protein n=1 Tax=Liquorilactobacillus sicerae TaxID=1416943 RepID=UPI00247FED27|nr:PDZ domain-containing protein [Liquorilactobacillus sicerae]
MLIKALAEFILQPVVWLTIIAVIISYFKRIKIERKQFRIAINNDFYEGRHLIKNGILFALIGSLIMISIGIMLPSAWIVVYQILIIVELLCFGLLTIDSIWFYFLSILLFALNSLGIIKPLQGGLLTSTWDNFLKSGVALMVLGAILSGFKLLMLWRFDPTMLLPIIKAGKRGRRLVNYSWRELTLIPLVCLIPGSQIQTLVPGWPYLTLAGHSFAIFILPAVISSGISFSRQAAGETLKFKKHQLQLLMIVFLLAAISCYLWIKLVPIAWLVLLGVTLTVAGVRYRFMRQQSNWYFETHDGIRIVAVKPKTPAAKMNLQPGDVILTCNGLKVQNERELYHALQQEPTYCRLKVRSYAGKLKLTQGAIFAGAPHEIGMIIFH